MNVCDKNPNKNPIRRFASSATKQESRKCAMYHLAIKSLEYKPPHQSSATRKTSAQSDGSICLTFNISLLP